MFDFSENIWYNHTVITNKGRCDMKPLSKSQQKIFDYLKECAGKGRVPSVREICEETGLSSTSTVHHHLKALEEKGLDYKYEHWSGIHDWAFWDEAVKRAFNLYF